MKFNCVQKWLKRQKCQTIKNKTYKMFERNVQDSRNTIRRNLKKWGLFGRKAAKNAVYEAAYEKETIMA